MSIILDALKKAEDSKNDPASPTAPVAKPPAATPSSLRKIGGGPVNKPRAIAMGLAIIAILGFMIFKNAGGPGGGPLAKITGLFFNTDETPVAVVVPVAVPTVQPVPAATGTAPVALVSPVTDPQSAVVVATVPGAPGALAVTSVPAPALSQIAPPQPIAAQPQTLTPQGQELLDAALDNYKNGNFEESAAEYEKLIVLDSLNPEIYNNYGVALKKAGKLAKAMSNYSKALALKPNYPEALNNLAVAYMGDNKYDAAKNLLEKAIVLEPDYIDAHLHLAICLEKTGQSQEAISYYEAFLRMSEKKVDRRIRLQAEDRLARLKER